MNTDNNKTPAPFETAPEVIRYEHIEKTDPDRTTKLARQWDKAEKDVAAGKVICLSDLMISAGM